MNALPKHLLRDVEVRFGTRVTALERHAAGVEIRFAEGEPQRFDHVLVCTPAPQAVPLLAQVHPDIAQAMAAVTVVPSWVAMVILPTDAPADWSAGTPADGSPLKLIVRNQTKPGRPPGEQIVLHASDDWSRTHLEDDADAVAQALWTAAQPHLGQAPPVHLTAHRWRYARVDTPVGLPCLFSEDGAVGVAGDGVYGDGVGPALASGAALAGRLLGHLHDREPTPTNAQLGLLGPETP